MAKYLSICRCSTDSDVWAIILDDEHDHSARLTPAKCGGLWQLDIRFQMDANALRLAAYELKRAAEELEGS